MSVEIGEAEENGSMPQHRFHLRVDSASHRTQSILSSASNATPNQRQPVEREGQHLTSNIQALMGVIKGNLGTGILSLPIALKYAGLLVGSVLLPVIGIIAMHCMHVLVRCSRKLSERNQVTALDYGEVAQLSVAEGPRWLRSRGHILRFVVNIFINITQIGFCCVYVVFISENVQQFINSFEPTQSVTESARSWIFTIDLWLYEIIVVLLIIPFTFVNKLATLSWLAAAANVVTAVGLTIIFVYCLLDLRSVSELPAFGKVSTLPLAFGIAVYAFEGNTLVLPIENQMRTPKAFDGLTGVLQTGMTIVICLYTGVAFYGYLRFGDDIQSSITLSMPTDYWLYLSLKPLFAVAIFISYLIQFYVPSTLLSRFIDSNAYLLRHTTPRMRSVLNITVRLLLVAFTLVAAATIPHIDLMTSLVGGLSGTSLAFTFPALFEILTFWNDPQYHDVLDLDTRENEADQPTFHEVNSSQVQLIPSSKTTGWRRRLPWWLLLTKNSLIILLGISGFVTGTATSIMQIVEAL